MKWACGCISVHWILIYKMKFLSKNHTSLLGLLEDHLVSSLDFPILDLLDKYLTILCQATEPTAIILFIIKIL